jgi:lipocalin
LFIYFSGHGIHVPGSEVWLLSRALYDPQEAVNVSGSHDQARYGGFSHVVMVSDACRTPARDLQTQQVEGSSIFANPMPRSSNPVDVFFATSLGDPSLEVKNSDNKYEALYT